MKLKSLGTLSEERGTVGLDKSALQRTPREVEGLAMGSCLELMRTLPAVRLVLVKIGFEGDGEEEEVE